MSKNKLKRCGIALLAIGSIVFTSNHYFSRNGILSQNILFTLPAVLAGFCLFYEKLKAVKFTIHLTAIYLGALSCSFIVACIKFPFGYWIANWRLNGHTLIGETSLSILVTSVFFWVLRELTDKEVMNELKKENIAAPKTSVFFIAGSILAIIPLITMTPHQKLLEEKAVQMAKNQTGSEYSYVVTKIHHDFDQNHRLIENSHWALVAAYNSSEFKTLTVHWKD